MQVILHVRQGPAAGKKIVVTPGQKALVGRASWADLSIAHDTEMSGRHFTLECDGSRCVLRDFRGSQGTFLNGGKVAEAILKHADQIVAGQTTFGVSIGDAARIAEAEPAAVAPSTPAPSSPEPSTAAPQDLLTILRGSAQPLFALLDAARDPRVLELLRASKEEYQSLYEGEKGDELAEFAPYLVKLPPQSPLLEALVEEGWGDSWGVFLTCAKPFDEVRKHFRHFLMVKLESGEEVYFRFYDPRVLRVFLPTCTREEIKEFFGPIGTFLLEDETLAGLIRFTPGGILGPKREDIPVQVIGNVPASLLPAEAT